MTTPSNHFYFLFRYLAFALTLSPFYTFHIMGAESNNLHYEPEKVTLTGTIERQTFPGRPGYESIKNGDEIERGWYLRISTPRNVEKRSQDSDPNTETEHNVEVLQLAWESEGVEKIIVRSVGKLVSLSGHLFHASNGHHHSRVLMWVDASKDVAK